MGERKGAEPQAGLRPAVPPPTYAGLGRWLETRIAMTWALERVQSLVAMI
jgi:hypothetical protein